MDLLAIFTASTIATLLYVLLGVGYALAYLSLLGLTNHSISYIVGMVLISQVFAATLGSLARRRNVHPRNAVRGFSIGIAALSALVVGASIGLFVPDTIRLVSIAILLIASSIMTLRNGYTKRDPGPLGDIVVGVIAGGLKALIGGGLTPALYLANKLLGYGFDEAIYRTLVSEIVICLAASIPYIIFLGVDFMLLTYSLLGVIMGSISSLIAMRRLSEDARRTTASIVMFLLGLILLFKTIARL